MHETTALPHAILSHHAATFAGFAPEPVPTPTSQEPVYLAALQASGPCPIHRFTFAPLARRPVQLELCSHG